MNDNNRDAERKEHVHEKHYRMSRPVGQRFELTSMYAAGTLILEDDEPEEPQPPSPPPAPRRVAFANLLNEARTGSADVIVAQTTHAEAGGPREEAAAEADRTVRRPQVIKQTVTYGLTDDNEDELERQEGTQGARKKFSTAVSYCKEKHVHLVCHWSDSDLTNRKGTWRLENVDYRYDTDIFDNGVEDHENCSCTRRSDLITELGKRMIAGFEENEDRMYDKKSKKQKDRDYRNGVEKPKSPPLVQVVRALGELAVYIVGDVGGTGNTGNAGEGGNDKKDRDEKADNRAKKTTKLNKSRQREANLAYLRRGMAEQARVKAADKKRIERIEEEQMRLQRLTNGMDPVDALFGTHARPASSTKARAQAPEDHGKASRLQTKRERVLAELDRQKREEELAEKRRSRRAKEVSSKQHLTKEERRMMRNINAAQKEEAAQDEENAELEQAAKDEEERLLQLAVEQEQCRGEVEETEEEDDCLTNAVEEALDNVADQDTPKKKKSVKNIDNKVTASKSRPATDEHDEREAIKTATKKPKKVIRKGTRPVVEDSLDDSDSVKALVSTQKAAQKVASKPSNKGPGTVRIRKVSFADHLAVKAVARDEEPAEQSPEPKATKTVKKPSTKEDNFKTEKKRTAKTQNGKPFKPGELIADSDLEDDATEVVNLPTDKLEGGKVSVETTSTEKTTSTTEQDGKIAEKIVETTTVAIKVEQEDGFTERTEVTAATVVSSTFSNDGEVTVEHATHTQSITALESSSHELPYDSPPALLERGLQVKPDTPTEASGIDVNVSLPPASPDPSTSEGVSSPSAKKWKHDGNTGEAQSEPDLDSARRKTPSPLKKRKITPLASPVQEEVTHPTGNVASSPSPSRNESIAETTSPTSPGAVSVALSTSSSSSKKRKLLWSEEDSEVMISPSGTKRVKRVQSNNEVREEVVEEAESTAVQAEDGKEYNSLFGSSPDTSEEGEEGLDQ